MEQVTLATTETSPTMSPRTPARVVGMLVMVPMALTALSFLLTGCGGQDTTADDASANETGSFRRISPTLGDESNAPVDVRILTTLRASDSPLPWVGTAHGGVRQVDVASPAGGRVAATQLLGRDQLKYVRGPVPAEARGFNQVTIEVVVDANRVGDSKEQARLYLYRDGKRLIDPLPADLEHHGDGQVVTFRSPLLRGDSIVPDEFAVALVGRVEGAALISVTFSEAPMETFAPPLSMDFGDALPLVRLGTTSRRSFGVLGGHPFRTSITLDEGEEFRSYLGLVPDAARPNELGRFTVRATGNGKEWTRIFEDVDG